MWSRNCLPSRNIWVHHQVLVGFVLRDFCFFVMFCRSLFPPVVPFLLGIVLSLLLRFMASDYYFGISKLFLVATWWRLVYNVGILWQLQDGELPILNLFDKCCSLVILTWWLQLIFKTRDSFQPVSLTWFFIPSLCSMKFIFRSKLANVHWSVDSCLKIGLHGQ
jgi:hypothetical protein